MGIQFFEEFESTSVDLVFAKEYLAEHPKEDGKQFQVTEVLLVKSNKGYLVKTDSFVTWLWKRSATATLLVQALDVYVRDCYGFAIVCVLDKRHKDACRLGVDGDIPTMWYGSAKKFTVEPDIPTFDPVTANPFLIPVAPSTPITHVATNGSNITPTSQRRHGKTS